MRLTIEDLFSAGLMEGEREAFGSYPCTKAGGIGTRHMRGAGLQRALDIRMRMGGWQALLRHSGARPFGANPESISPCARAAQWIPGSLAALAPRNDEFYEAITPPSCGAGPARRM